MPRDTRLPLMLDCSNARSSHVYSNVPIGPFGPAPSAVHNGGHAAAKCSEVRQESGVSTSEMRQIDGGNEELHAVECQGECQLHIVAGQHDGTSARENQPIGGNGAQRGSCRTWSTGERWPMTVRGAPGSNAPRPRFRWERTDHQVTAVDDAADDGAPRRAGRAEWLGPAALALPTFVVAFGCRATARSARPDRDAVLQLVRLLGGAVGFFVTTRFAAESGSGNRVVAPAPSQRAGSAGSPARTADEFEPALGPAGYGTIGAAVHRAAIGLPAHGTVRTARHRDGLDRVHCATR